MRIILLLTFAFVSVQAIGQTIPAPQINCASTNSANGEVTITYDTSNVSNPCGGSFEGYVIYGAQDSPNNSYSVIDTIQNAGQTEYIHAGNGTVVDWYYYMVAIFDCPGATPASSDTISEEPLEAPELNFVTITKGDSVLLDWDKSTSSQTYAYKIYYSLGDSLTTVTDTVIGVNNTTYIDSLINPNAEKATYTIEACDSCGNPSQLNPNPQNSILLNLTQPDACEQAVTLNWNEYINWPSGVKEYQIRVNTGDTSYTQATVLDTTYELDIGTVTSDSACVTIRAVSNNGVTSNSNDVCFSASGVDAVSYNYLTNLTVTKDNNISVSYLYDSTADLNKIFINRKGAKQDSFETVRETNPPANYNFPNTYTDEDANPKNQPYEFRTSVSDVCESQVPSNKGKTIHLTVERGDEFTNQVDWNSFELGYATVLRYRLYRNIEGTFVPLKTFQPGDSAFTDNVVQQLDTDGEFCYYVKAFYKLQLPNGQDFTLESRSNIDCIEQATVAIMPNAFTPRGVNNKLQPRIVFPVGGNYTFQIFNRWGQRIFETKNISEGWDGTYNGQEAQTGGYVYRIKFTDPKGNKVEKKGTFILFK